MSLGLAFLIVFVGVLVMAAISIALGIAIYGDTTPPSRSRRRRKL